MIKERIRKELEARREPALHLARIVVGIGTVLALLWLAQQVLPRFFA